MHSTKSSGDFSLLVRLCVLSLLGVYAYHYVRFFSTCSRVMRNREWESERIRGVSQLSSRTIALKKRTCATHWSKGGNRKTRETERVRVNSSLILLFLRQTHTRSTDHHEAGRDKWMSSSFNVYIGTEEVNGRANEFLSLRSLSLSLVLFIDEWSRENRTYCAKCLSVYQREGEWVDDLQSNCCKFHPKQVTRQTSIGLLSCLDEHILFLLVSSFFRSITQTEAAELDGRATDWSSNGVPLLMSFVRE